jgi:hypothetical protein
LNKNKTRTGQRTKRKNGTTEAMNRIERGQKLDTAGKRDKCRNKHDESRKKIE